MEMESWATYQLLQPLKLLLSLPVAASTHKPRLPPGELKVGNQGWALDRQPELCIVSKWGHGNNDNGRQRDVFTGPGCTLPAT